MFVLTVLASFFTMSFVITEQEPPLFKNLKVLPKNITKEQMDSVMKHYTTALGVKCNFCHVRNEGGKEWDFAADKNKHKLMAREMIKMTQDINKKYFDVTGAKSLNAALMVNCYTCHHGKKEPESKPVLGELKAMPQAPADSSRREQRPMGDSALKQ